MLKEPFHHLPTDSVLEFQDAIIGWFDETGKSYPWRETCDPYAILVSEMMLQQTQITTVLSRGYYTRWLERFPNLESLAEAPEQDLLTAWEGLGYYNRARNLQKLAIHVTESLNGVFPVTAAQLIKLPGIGPYTAGAVASFAFNESAPIVDGNIIRVFSRLFDYNSPVDTTQSKNQLWNWAEALVSRVNPRAYNSGLMELGQRICRKGQPDCLSCPVAKFCLSTQPAKLPIKKGKITVTQVEEHAIWQIQGGKILLHQEQGTRRKGFWKLPLREKGSISGLPLLSKSSYGITRYKVTLKVYQAPTTPSVSEGDTWIPLIELDKLPVAAPFRKVIDQLIQE